MKFLCSDVDAILWRGKYLIDLKMYYFFKHSIIMLRQLLLNYLKKTERMALVYLSFRCRILYSLNFIIIFLKLLQILRILYQSVGKENFFLRIGETSYKLSVNICTKFLYFIQIRIHNYLMQPFWIINGMVKHVNYWLIYVRSSFIPEI